VAALLLALGLGGAGGVGCGGDDSGGGGGSDAPPGDGGGEPDGVDRTDSPPAAGPPTRDEFERFCAVTSSCFEGVGDCFDDLLWAAPDAVRCGLAASDCTEVYACLGITVTTGAPCTPGCDGDLVVECDSGSRVTTDCSRDLLMEGSTCLVGNFGPECGGRLCSGEGVTCEGTRLHSCDVDRGVTEVFDCARFGLTCVEPTAGLARCTDGTSVACQDGSPARCDGARMVSCEGGFEVSLDCAFLVEGLTCQTWPGSGRVYCGYGTACDPVFAKGEETCDGTVMTYCAAGEIATLDCTDFGFSICEENPIFGGNCTN